MQCGANAGNRRDRPPALDLALIFGDGRLRFSHYCAYRSTETDDKGRLPSVKASRGLLVIRRPYLSISLAGMRRDSVLFYPLPAIEYIAFVLRHTRLLLETQPPGSHTLVAAEYG
jgi:hypothetical protein